MGITLGGAHCSVEKRRFTMEICFTQHTQTHNIGKRSKQQRRLSGSKKEWTVLNVAQPDGHDHLHCTHGHWHHYWLVPCYQDPPASFVNHPEHLFMLLSLVSFWYHDRITDVYTIASVMTDFSIVFSVHPFMQCLSPSLGSFQGE